VKPFNALLRHTSEFDANTPLTRYHVALAYGRFVPTLFILSTKETHLKL